MRYLSLCSGIEAATVAWHPLGWQAVAFAEIEAFPSAVLAHHYPTVPNWGDMTKFKDWSDAAVDVLVGGTPCQSFSVAGLRKGMADPRGNLALTYLAIADRYRPDWLVWENVPGVLSSDGGRDFGAFLGGLGELGYGFAYRVLDAQFVRVDGFGRAVPQRRRRVFVVGNSRDWRRAAAVLFERESLSWNPEPHREARERTTGRTLFGLELGNQGSGGNVGWFHADGPCRTLDTGAAPGVASTGEVSHCLNAGGMGRIDYETETMIAHSLRAEDFDASEDGTGRGTPLVPIAFGWQNSASQGDSVSEHVAPSLDKSKTPVACYPINTQIATRHEALGEGTGLGIGAPGDPGYTLQAGHSHAIAVADTLTSNGDAHSGYRDEKGLVPTGWAVRRLTPTECERLQGFPDGWTDVPYRGKPAADGPRYKALGNSMAVNVMRWIGRRIELVESISAKQVMEAAE